MNIYKCDLCGAVIEKSYLLTISMSDEERRYIFKGDYHYCKKCADELNVMLDKGGVNVTSYKI